MNGWIEESICLNMFFCYFLIDRASAEWYDTSD